MTKRQKALGVTEFGYEVGIKEGNFLLNIEAFLAKMATVKKGEYIGLELTKMLLGNDCCAVVKHEYDVKPLLRVLTAIMPEHFYYTDTNNLDCLTLK